MKSRPAILAIQLAIVAALAACTVAMAQVAPAATETNPELYYDLNYSQTAEFYDGEKEGALQRAIGSADLKYLNGNEHTPLDLTYSGGYIEAISGENNGTGFFQHLLLSQGYVERRWAVNLSDDFGYYPQSPTTGFSGIPGVGDFPGPPPPPSNDSVLTLTTRSLINTAVATFEHSLSRDITFNVGGDFESVRYPDGGGLDINQAGVRPQVSWRLNALNSISAQYIYSHSNYLGSTFVIETQSVQPGFVRVWNRHLTTKASAGPEWVKSNSNFFIPPSLGVAANAEVTYTAKSSSASVGFVRSVSAGAGFSSEIGVRTSSAAVSIFHSFGRDVTAGATGSYISTQGLVGTGITSGVFGGVNAARRFGQYITASANYTAIHQTSSLTLQPNSLQGLSQVIGFNIAYHPREIHPFKR